MNKRIGDSGTSTESVSESISHNAFPVVFEFAGKGFVAMGLSKRELFAAMAMQSMFAHRLTSRVMDSQEIARDAVEAADALMAELEKKP